MDKNRSSRNTAANESKKPPITQEHDAGYKSIFSKKRNFLHFLKKYIKAEWVKYIDENDLIPINTTFIDEEYQNKESDVIYKIKFKGSEIIFYILLELQSTVDQTMPFRLLKYITELMKREFDNTPKNERESTDYRLPAVIPIILYNGADNWTAVRSFKEYVQGYEQFGEYIVDFRYFLFDLNRMTEETILSTNQLLDIIFALDRKPNRKNMERMLKIAFENLGNMNDIDRNDLLRWIRYIYLNHIKDENEKTKILSKLERGEVTNMMYGIDMYIEEEIQKGIQKGIQKIIKKNIQKDKKERNIELAEKMLAKNKPIDEIIEFTGLKEKEILLLMKNK